MDTRFNADEWAALPPADRIRSCRLMASEARSRAQAASSSTLRTAYSDIARSWDELANEIEQHSAE